MHRYIAFAWNAQLTEGEALADEVNRRVKANVPDMSCILRSQGLLVYRATTMPTVYKVYDLPLDGGVVLGTLFRRRAAADRSSHCERFSERAAARLQQSKGRCLAERYWGRYVALVKLKPLGEIRILRDPTGAMPCFITTVQNINVIFSHIEDCAQLGMLRASINWNHLIAYLCFDHMVVQRTGIDSVRQVHAGECLAIGTKGITSTYYWSPDVVYSRRIVSDRQQAMRMLRDVVEYSVGTWASCYSSILHTLSGGLDSSIVLSCLARAPSAPRIACENHFLEGVEGDERAFARQSAKAANVELIEMPLQASSHCLPDMFSTVKVPTPSLIAFVPDTLPHREKAVKARGVEAVFSGQGGDHLFQNVRTRYIAAEYAWHHGIRGDLLNVILDTCRFTREPIWSVMKAVIWSGLFRRASDPYDKVKPSMLLTKAARHAIDFNEIRHPWVDAAACLPSAKRLQVFSIVDTQNFFRVPDHYADIVHPLIAQPIIETCIEIPSYMLTYGGIDRALIRQAFAGSVPSEILSRTTKGATTGYFHKLLAENLHVLRELLLGGALVREGILDKQQVEAALSLHSLMRSPFHILPILDATRAEIWLASWASDHRRVAA